MPNIDSRLNELGLELPEPPKPVAAYVPTVRTGNLVFVSGQVPIEAGEPLAAGRVPSQVSIDTARHLAGRCVLNALAALRAELNGDLSALRRAVRIGVFVASDDDFHGQPKVADGASELLVAILGDAGRHARAAVGVNALPLNVPVEVEFTFELA